MNTEHLQSGHSTPFVGSEFTDKEFDAVRDLLRERRGFDLGMYKDRCIKRRIATRVRALGFREAAPYIDVLRGDEEEVDALMAALSIHVSQFFRNPTTFAALETRILPELIRRAHTLPTRRLRLWSVGCAGGEEPYSLALLLDELAPQGIEVSILGSDISGPILERAREGVYDHLRLSEVPKSVRQQYFAPEGRNFRLDQRIRHRVRFERHDILNEQVYPPADLILCRNVLIYFSREEQERIIDRFADALTPGGILVLGRAETMLGAVRGRFEVECPAERVYRRR